MMFNNRFNKDNTIHFVREEWECTDNDEFQFCRKVNDTTFEYIQLKDKKLVEGSLCLGRQILDYLNDETHAKDWYQDEICVDDYDAEEIAGYLSSYDGILDGIDDVVLRNQLVAECIFETDVVFSGDYDNE